MDQTKTTTEKLWRDTVKRNPFAAIYLTKEYKLPALEKEVKEYKRRESAELYLADIRRNIPYRQEPQNDHK